MSPQLIRVKQAAQLSGYSADHLRHPRCPLQPVAKDKHGRRLYSPEEAAKIGEARRRLRAGK